MDGWVDGWVDEWMDGWVISYLLGLTRWEILKCDVEKEGNGRWL